MKYEKVVVKQIPDDTSVLTGLNKYHRSKMPGTGDFLQASVGPDGRFITGIDEEAYSVNMIKDKEEKDKAKQDIKEIREFLERSTNQKDLGGTSSFWETFGVKLTSDQDTTLNKANPFDIIKYNLLVSNGYAAPDKESAATPAYIHCKYYCFVEERQENEDISTQKKRDKARSELVRITEDEDHALVVAQYLVGDKAKKGMKPDTIYRILSDYINDKDPENLKRFSKAVSLGSEDIQFKITVDRAIKKKIIKMREGYYQRGQVTFGKSLPEVYSNLKKPENAGEFISIQEELEPA